MIFLTILSSSGIRLLNQEESNSIAIILSERK
jgi:hypothetical protein